MKQVLRAHDYLASSCMLQGTSFKLVWEIYQLAACDLELEAPKFQLFSACFLKLLRMACQPPRCISSGFSFSGSKVSTTLV